MFGDAALGFVCVQWVRFGSEIGQVGLVHGACEVAFLKPIDGEAKVFGVEINATCFVDSIAECDKGA